MLGDLLKLIVFMVVSWFILFVDNCTQFTWVYLMKQKFRLAQSFPFFITSKKNQFDAKVLTIRSDNGREYFN